MDPTVSTVLTLARRTSSRGMHTVRAARHSSNSPSGRLEAARKRVPSFSTTLGPVLPGATSATSAGPKVKAS